MPNICPFHQFEIRFTPIINFSQVAKDIIAPYVQRTTTFQLENENTINEKLSLNFDGDSYSVIAWGDRIILRTTAGLEHLSESNSIFNEPFFAIFQKFQKLASFGKINNILFYTLSINENSKDVRDRELDYITKNYLQKAKAEEIMPGFDDVALVLEKKSNKEEMAVTFGPYKGPIDFQKRNIILTNENLKKLAGIFGTMIEYKFASYDIKLADLGMNFYKECLNTYKRTVNKI